MSKPLPKYERTFEDELDWNLVDQLHSVVLQIGTFCFRTKQVCVTVEIAVIGILARFMGETLDRSIFVAGLLIPLVFWTLDSIAYFYQVKLRGMIDSIRSRMTKRHSDQIVLAESVRVIDEKRLAGTPGTRLRHAFFNHSMWFYLILVVVDGVLWGAFEGGVIQ